MVLRGVTGRIAGPVGFYFSSMGVWQQVTVPSPPLVTMNSELHLVQT